MLYKSCSVLGTFSIVTAVLSSDFLSALFLLCVLHLAF